LIRLKASGELLGHHSSLLSTEANMPPLQTDFLLADNAHARWVRRSDTAGDFVTVQEMHVEPAVRPHPQGVAFESGGGRFNIEEKRGVAQKRRYRFAATLANAINAKAASGELFRLCLAAPPRTVAAIRRGLTKEAEARLAHILPKDLTKTPDHELRDWLRRLELN
jgi:protein required for attachment to host cells